MGLNFSEVVSNGIDSALPSFLVQKIINCQNKTEQINYKRVNTYTAINAPTIGPTTGIHA